MTFMIPALRSADTFPQAKACAPRRCGGGKVSAGWGYLLLSRRGSPSRFRWPCLGVSVALFCRAVGSHGAVFTMTHSIQIFCLLFFSVNTPVVFLCGLADGRNDKFKRSLLLRHNLPEPEAMFCVPRDRLLDIALYV